MIHVEEIGTIGARLLHMLLLITGRSDVLRLHRTALIRRWIVPDTARPTRVCHTTVAHHFVLADHGAIDVGGVYVRFIHTHNGGVVFEVTLMPAASDKTNAHVSEPIVDTAVVANLTAPITRMENIKALLPPPIRRRPQRALVRSRNPRPWNPVVTFIAVSPVAGSPHQVRFRTRRLYINGQDRRGKANADKYTRFCLRNGNERKHQRPQDPARRTDDSHRNSPKDRTRLSLAGK